MRFLLALLAGLCLVASTPVFADDDPDPPSASFVADEIVITGSIAPRAVIDSGDALIVKDVINDVVNVITDPKPVSALVIIALIIAILIKLTTTLGAFKRLLERTGKTWLRPLIAAGLGGAGGLVTALAAGARDAISLVSAFVAGAYAGFSASGSVDALRVTFFPHTRTKASVDETALDEAGGALESAVVAAHVDAGSHIQTARARIADTASLTPAKRVEALAGLLRAAPR